MTASFIFSNDEKKYAEFLIVLLFTLEDLLPLLLSLRADAFIVYPPKLPSEALGTLIPINVLLLPLSPLASLSKIASLPYLLFP